MNHAGAQVPTNVGVIGLGVGADLARAVAEDHFGRVVALCDIDSTVVERVSAFHADAECFVDGFRLIESPDVQAIIVATPDDRHVTYVLRALELGKSVFCEKPLALTEPELRSISHALESAPVGTVLTTNTLLRSAPRYTWFREQLASGRLGHVVAAQAGYFYGRFHKVVDGWRGGIPNYSVVLGGGIHMIDLLSWVLDEWPIGVSASGSRRGARLHGFDFPDSVEAVLRFPSGLVASLSVSFASAFPHLHHLTIQGSEASFVNLPTGQALLLNSGGVIEEVSLAAKPASKGALVHDFLSACRGEGDAAISAADTLYAAAVAISIDEAVRTGNSVEVARTLGASPLRAPSE